MRLPVSAGTMILRSVSPESCATPVVAHDSSLTGRRSGGDPVVPGPLRAGRARGAAAAVVPGERMGVAHRKRRYAWGRSTAGESMAGSELTKAEKKKSGFAKGKV